ncbi:Uncharacterised protein [Actinomyces bovis]|uniref:Uncharacterized protein n=1 Tax=Actinomyces bovis TaxID=1658 RepID=A0ABY1VM59_9ACTO|nr:Uncharacterised protein [Actinomyces bovis]VEG52408.1 Uncharacterised protein [Actinomyces israelii]
MTKNDGVIVASDAADWKDKTVYVPKVGEFRFNV